MRKCGERHLEEKQTLACKGHAIFVISFSASTLLEASSLEQDGERSTRFFQFISRNQ